ncbi:DUF397 domain-containing protein [Streptomyces sp. NPDC021749]|uniref:DUF397 domain-containing protein n=1 Tax=Streptomyces sp. NPDC021749 TaxID=3154905 RepID=UPI0033CF1F92
MSSPASGDLTWFKSSYSASEGGNCIEVAYDWHKSSYSSDEGGDCVEVAASPSAIHVRDSKNPAGPTLALGVGAWQAFVAAVVD